MSSPVCGSMANPFRRGEGGLLLLKPDTGSGWENGNQTGE